MEVYSEMALDIRTGVQMCGGALGAGYLEGLRVCTQRDSNIGIMKVFSCESRVMRSGSVMGSVMGIVMGSVKLGL